MAAPTTVAAGATGLRAWLVTRSWSWLTRRRLRWATGTILALALALSATGSA